MRLSMLLDTTRHGDLQIVVAPQTSPVTTGATTTAPAAPTTSDASSFDRREFNRLVESMLPCRVEDPELWFAEKTADVEQAKALCRTCPLVAGCLAGAIEREEPWGVWGGEVFVDGHVVAVKRGRGRPRKVRPEELAS